MVTSLNAPCRTIVQPPLVEDPNAERTRSMLRWINVVQGLRYVELLMFPVFLIVHFFEVGNYPCPVFAICYCGTACGKALAFHKLGSAIEDACAVDEKVRLLEKRITEDRGFHTRLNLLTGSIPAICSAIGSYRRVVHLDALAKALPRCAEDFSALAEPCATAAAAWSAWLAFSDTRSSDHQQFWRAAWGRDNGPPEFVSAWTSELSLPLVLAALLTIRAVARFMAAEICLLGDESPPSSRPEGSLAEESSLQAARPARKRPSSSPSHR